MKNYLVTKNDFKGWDQGFDFTSKKGIQNIKVKALEKVKSIPSFININGRWSIIQKLDNGTNKPTPKYITYINV